MQPAAEITAADLRPYYHFATLIGWLNDPNGLLYLDGEYHLFYQHHPDSTVWGPMHWGHAVSRDLVTWENLPIALAPDALGTIFSGSAVIDHANTAGFGTGAMVAIFTHDAPGRQSQSLAYSLDRGRTWVKYSGNPVLAPPEGFPDFRDPKVFWYGDGGTGHWAMLLAVGRSIWIYRSPDLKQWTKTDEISGRGASAGVWECPDLVELPVVGIESATATRWVLVVSVQQGAPAGGSGVQYFLGDFDGDRFVPAEDAATVRWADYGADFYAPQAWNDAPGGRRVWLAWMSNWDYARETPATTWRGAMTLPRDLSLVRDADGLRLLQRPIPELEAARQPLSALGGQAVAPGENPLANVRGSALDLMVRVRVDGSAASRFGIRVRVGAHEQTTIGYNLARRILYVDRSKSGAQASGFAAPHIAPLEPRDGVVDLRIIVDQTSVEVFADGGRLVFTEQIFPQPGSDGLELFVDDGPLQVEELVVYALRSSQP